MLKDDKIPGVEETSRHLTALQSAGGRGPSWEGIAFFPPCRKH